MEQKSLVQNPKPLKKASASKPLRNYETAWIFFKDGNNQQGWNVCVFQGLVIFFDGKGDEHTIPMYYIQEVRHYAVENDN